MSAACPSPLGRNDQADAMPDRNDRDQEILGPKFDSPVAAREAARRMQCSNNLKQMVLSIHNDHDTYHVFPAALLGSGRYNNAGYHGRVGV